MRRRDREITDFEEMIQIMEKCDVCRIAMVDEDNPYPYMLPLNFGMEREGEQVTFYFHGAHEGRKYELMQRHPQVSFEMDCEHLLFLDEVKGSCSMAYESVIGHGVMEIVTDEEEKLKGLHLIMEHYGRGDFAFNPASVGLTTVFRLRVEGCTGKHRPGPKKV